MPLGAYSLHFFPEFISLAHSLLASFHCRGLLVSHANCISLRLLWMCFLWTDGSHITGEVPACTSCSSPQSSTHVCFGHRYVCPATQRWTDALWKEREKVQATLMASALNIFLARLKCDKRRQQPQIEIDDLAELFWRAWMYSSENKGPSFGS